MNESRRICVVCNRSYMGIGRQNTCGYECRKRRQQQKLSELARRRKQDRAQRQLGNGYDGKCVVCKRELHGMHPNSRYCSDECRAEGLRQAIERQRERRTHEKDN